jgi:heat shock protein HspQ
VSEVYPVFRNGELWYQVNSVQSDTGVYAYTAFYNPGEDTLLKAYEDEQISHFYQGSDESYTQPDKEISVPGEDSESRTIENPTLWVVVEDDDGDTYTVPVAENESINVSQDEPKNDSE